MLHIAVTPYLALIDGLGFDPFFRGFLSVLTGIVVLMGSTYLIVATNTGARTGLLIALTSLFGWFFLMGIVWTIYGIGWRGDPPTWDLVEINVDDAEDDDDGLLFSEIAATAELVPTEGGLPDGGLGDAGFDDEAVLDRAFVALSGSLDELQGVDSVDDLTPEQKQLVLEAAGLEVATIGEIDDPDLAQEAALLTSRTEDLGPWRYLEASDPTRGEAQASVDAYLVEEDVFAAGEYLPQQFGAFVVDGKPQLEENANFPDRILHTLNETILHPTFDNEYIVVQVRGTLDQATLPGQPPPVATVDEEAPLVSVIMERNRGGPFPAFFSGLRFTPAMFTVFSGLLFALLAWNMHVRDERETRLRAAA